MSGADEEWVRAAMSDDAMVVELLVRLHHAPPSPPPLKWSPLPLEWSFRRRRSKSASANENRKKPARGHRGSPTTPLSWSGAASFSGGSAGAGGFCSDECSRPPPPKLSGASGSKVKIDGEKIDSKRSRKKKTLAELRIEEKSLVKERKDLKREKATLSLYLERQRATNANLKKMKVELQSRLDEETKSTNADEDSVSGRIQKEGPASRHIPTSVFPAIEKEAKLDMRFVLLDLNVPFFVKGRN